MFTVLGGKLRLHNVQPRPTEDPLWLATTMPALPRGAQVMDAGCGSGIAGLALLSRQPHLHLTAVDIDPTLTELAQTNATLNNLTLTTHTANLLSLPPLGPFDAILSNPPYHGEDRGHTTPNPSKTQAHTLPAGHLPLWLAALTRCLTPQGTLHLILHTACEADLRTFAPAHGYALHLTPLQTSPSRQPKRLLAALIPALIPQIITNSALPAYNPTLRQHHLGA